MNKTSKAHRTWWSDEGDPVKRKPEKRRAKSRMDKRLREEQYRSVS